VTDAPRCAQATHYEHASSMPDPLLRRSVCAAGQAAYSLVRRRIELSATDREFPALTGRSGTSHGLAYDGWRLGALVFATTQRATHYESVPMRCLRA
jgi:hypothetical protein